MILKNLFVAVMVSALALVGMLQLAQAAPRQDWHFKVYLDDREIGHHRMTLSQQGGATLVSINAEFDVKFLFISAYRYLHQNQEVWHGDCLQSIRSFTNDNGEELYVRGRTDAGSLSVETAGGERNHPGCIKTFAYWDADIVNSNQLLNAQTGELLPVTAEDLGTATITVRNQAVQTRHYRLLARDFTIELWYSADRHEWLALKSTTRDGAVLHYRII